MSSLRQVEGYRDSSSVAANSHWSLANRRPIGRDRPGKFDGGPAPVFSSSTTPWTWWENWKKSLKKKIRNRARLPVRLRFPPTPTDNINNFNNISNRNNHSNNNGRVWPKRCGKCAPNSALKKKRKEKKGTETKTKRGEDVDLSHRRQLTRTDYSAEK